MTGCGTAPEETEMPDEVPITKSGRNVVNTQSLKAVRSETPCSSVKTWKRKNRGIRRGVLTTYNNTILASTLRRIHVGSGFCRKAGGRLNIHWIQDTLIAYGIGNQSILALKPHSLRSKKPLTIYFILASAHLSQAAVFIGRL